MMAAFTRGRSTRSLVGFALLIPALAFLIVFLVAPSFTLLSYSVLTQHQNGDVSGPLNLTSYQRLLFDPSYQRVILLTLRIALWTSFISVLLAYPLAMAIAFGKPFFSRLTMILVVMPLVVSVIVRTYGWQLLLGNNQSGVVNWVLSHLGFGKQSVQLLYTDWAVIIASIHVFLPLMVLPLATSLARIAPSLNSAARMLGASAWRAFIRVTLPLSLPGLTAGVTIVFSLTAASYVTPAMIGGSKGAMLGNLLEQQMTTVYDWSMGGAIGVVMVIIALVVNVGINWLVDRRSAVATAKR